VTAQISDRTTSRQLFVDPNLPASSNRAGD
jgi:hypothetical protein